MVVARGHNFMDVDIKPAWLIVATVLGSIEIRLLIKLPFNYYKILAANEEP